MLCLEIVKRVHMWKSQAYCILIAEEGVGEGAATSEMSSGEGGDGRQGEVPSVYEVDRGEFEDILLTMEMMQDHLPGSYLDAVNQL